MSDKKEEKIPKAKKPVVLIPPEIISKPEDDYEPDEPKIGPPVDVLGDVTPITRKPVKKVNSELWNSMNINQLYEQLSVIENRLVFARQRRHEDLIIQLFRGSQQLRIIIRQKTSDEIKLI